LYRWLQTHQADIRQAREAGAGWSEILQAAREDNIPLREDANARRDLQKTWNRVCRAEEKFVSTQAKSIVTRTEATPPRIMPSRLPRDWRPEFVDSPSNGEPDRSDPGSSSQEKTRTSALPVGADNGEPEKNALATTIPCAVASSGDEVEPVPEVSKTRAQVIFEGYKKRLADDANRKAGYIPREER